ACGRIATVPREKTDQYWVQRVWALASEDGMRSPAIYRAVMAEGERQKRNDYPSERQIRRLLADYRALPEHERREHAYFTWPDTMLTGALPWEASRAVLDLVQWRMDQERDQPTVRLAKWFWRLRLAVPSIPVDAGEWLAEHLAAGESIK